MRNDSSSLPKTLAGVVCQQFVRCGRANCRCRLGQPHGPYFYRFWRDRGRLRKAYVRRADVTRVRAECEARQKMRVATATGWQEWRAMVEVVKQAERS